MAELRRISSTGTQDLWDQVNSDFVSGVSMHDYHVVIERDNQDIELAIVSSPGGSAEGGYDTTRLTTHLQGRRGFHFAIHPEDFLYKIGKIFGMEDITTGYPEFDKNVIVKTNDPGLFKNIFSPVEVRQVFENLSGYSFKIVPHDDKESDHLELYIQRGITNASELQPIFDAFCHVSASLDKR